MCLSHLTEPFPLQKMHDYVVGWKIMEQVKDGLRPWLYNKGGTIFKIGKWYASETDREVLMTMWGGTYIAGFHFCPTRHEAILFQRVTSSGRGMVLVKCLFTPPWYYGMDEVGTYTAVSSHIHPVAAFRIPRTKKIRSIFSVRNLRLQGEHPNLYIHKSGRVRSTL